MYYWGKVWVFFRKIFIEALHKLLIINNILFFILLNILAKYELTYQTLFTKYFGWNLIDFFEAFLQK